ncbi:hypothetical protein [Enhygromyxa salina]|uniref:Cytochrome c domain-containing protein n=1 Tax=Enhygromyxa salina TaxID=215803 RepID=A0A2S9YDP5_9BACT|nr:hypothetical protein [Enhygromyxa salina]PRQ03126.1 hypothetical protein ENSA7_53970 [Enhygromyxa salina]
MKKLLVSLSLVFAACDGGDEHGHEEHHEEHGETHGEHGGEPSGAECDASLTYEEFAAPFMQSYCTGCHSSTLTGPARNGAPDGHDFDSLAGILAVAGHVDQYAAAGPDATNELMPPSGPAPSHAEREMLGAWLACELAP